MRRIALTIVAALLLCSCPGPGGKVDPWLTARTIITQTQNALFFIDGIFNQWLLGQPDDKRDEVESKYLMVRQAVIDGLRLALDGVDIAEQAKKDPDVQKLMEAADKAWLDLKTFVANLLKTPSTMPPGLKGVPPTQDLQKQLALLPDSLYKKRRASP